MNQTHKLKCICLTLYNETVHWTIRTRYQSVRRQHRRRTSEKSEMVTYKDNIQVARNMWFSIIWIQPLGRMQNDMLKLIITYLLNNLALFWWAKNYQGITGFLADNSFSWIKPLVRRRHILKEISKGFSWKIPNRNYHT